MSLETATQLARVPEILNLSAGYPFFDLAQEINDMIARRAYE